MGIELVTEPDPVRIDFGFVLIGESWPIAINPNDVSTVEARPLQHSKNHLHEVTITMSRGAQHTVHVLRFWDVLRALVSAIAWRNSCLHPQSKPATNAGTPSP